MEDEDDSLSHSGDSTAGSESDYHLSPKSIESDVSECDNDEEEIPAAPSAPPRKDQRKSQNVAALVCAMGSTRPALVNITNRFNTRNIIEDDDSEESVSLPPGIEPLVLWQPEESKDRDSHFTSIVVDPLLVKFLRPHQRLGKTLQSITLLYTLLRQGFDGKPMVKKAIIVTPTSLVSNWDAEIKKWVGERVKLVALCESTREDVISGIDSFTCSRSSLQNDLEEFYAMVNFTNPGVLGDASYFRRYYEMPIVCGREPTSTAEEKRLGSERSAELSAKVNQVKRAISDEAKQSKILAYITVLKKLCNHPKTLELFAQLCRERRYPFLRLDGTTSISKRQKLVNRFNDPSKDEFAFLLSSKAGGCGLNLIGGNRLVLFDPDWNPANDKQAAARVWRDGQKKRVYIYRFLTTGTIEEKVYQRQMSKEGLQKVIQQEHVDSEKGNLLSAEDLRDLFTFNESVSSEIHEKMCCNRCKTDEIMLDISFDSKYTDEGCRLDEKEDIGGFAGIAGCVNNLKRHEKQVGTPKEEDLASWGHHHFPSSVPDSIFQASAGDEVSFVFTNQVEGKLVPVESTMRPMIEKIDEHKNQNSFKKPSPRGALFAYQQKRTSQSFSHNGGSIGSSSNMKPSPQPHSKLMRTLQGKTDVTQSPKISPGIQTPSNLLFPACINDDDFQ
ncbi:hypothetical protein DH2020_006660 [Rehmannia glutinosa]|uniref:Helicase C-terminal domain-containing protein n=1 Tax=Rehmannia glutinosa TaxID=99300 RepID=A0ABR0XK33_REHGL